jgi:penicillin-binding protein 1A
VIVGGVSLLAIGLGIGCFAAYVAAIAGEVPSISGMKPRLHGVPSVVYAGNGQRLGYMTSDVIRVPIAQSQQPKLLREATVAVEDRNFWHHGAVDYEGLVRAALADVMHGGTDEQGGSTLTMQLVKNTYPYLERISSTRSLKYKIAEAKLATELYAHHSRQWILTQYLNDVEYTTVDSHNAFGVQAASELLFDKHVQKLDLAQYALLAGLPQEPSGYNPFSSPAFARGRRGIVLQAMVRSHYITQAQADAAQAQPLQVKEGDIFSKVSQPYVFAYVQQQLVHDLGQRTVDHGGLKVYTTINLADQEYAKEAIDENEGFAGDPGSSLVSIDPSNGHILAMQNSTKYGYGKGETTFNYAAQAQRQTGSVFKAFVLMTLIRDWDGNPNDTYYNSSPLPAGWLPGYPTYSVANASESDAQGNISVTKATTLSINAVYAQLGVDVGMTKVTAMANAMGLDDPDLASNPAEAIGGLNHGVSTLQVADAYSTIANYGEHVPATIIDKVVLPSGKVLNFGDPKHTRVFSQGQAYAATQVLQTVIQDGTGTSSNYGCPAAGKTGTTSNYTDAWFAGYNPKLTTAVWVGYPKEAEFMEDVNGLGPGYGGTLAGPIWKDYMAKATDGYCGSFPQPDSYWQGKPYFGAHSKTSQGNKSFTSTSQSKTSTSTKTSSTSTTATGTSTSPHTGTTPTPGGTTTTKKSAGGPAAPPATDPPPP